HHMFLDISFFRKHAEDRRNFIAVFFDYRMCAFFEHTRYILVESASCDVAACFYSHACLADTLESLYVNSCRCKKGFSERTSQTLMIRLQRLSAHVKYFSYKRKSVAVYTGGSDADQDISFF